MMNESVLVVDLRLGLLIPPVYAIYEKKPVPSYELFFKDGGEGGIRPPIRCRIHTFQACSFSHSDTHQIVVPVLLERALI